MQASSLQRTPARTARTAVVVLVFALLCGGGDAGYNATRACEFPLQRLTVDNTSTYTRTTVTTVGDLVITETDVVQISTVNATETLMLWVYFSHDLSVDPTAASTLHNNETAYRMCNLHTRSLSALRKVLQGIVTGCQCDVLHSCSHFYTALYRLETECSVNATEHHCVTPRDFFTGPYSETTVESDTVVPEIGTTITTKVTTVTEHPLTWGPADLMVQACPGSCPADGDKNKTGWCADEGLNPPPSVDDCCMRVFWDYGTKYLGLGPEAECTKFRNLGDECAIVPSVFEEIAFATGGAVALRDGSGVSIPAGAISSDQCSDPCAIEVAMASTAAAALVIKSAKSANPLWTKVKVTTAILELSPDGIKFSTPATVCVKVAADSNVSAANYNDVVKIHQFNLTSGEIIGDQYNTSKSFDVDKNLVCFETTHFSAYGGLSYSELSEETTKDKEQSNNNLGVILGAIFGSLAAFAVCLAVWYVSVKNQQDELDTTGSTNPYNTVEFLPVQPGGFVSAEMPFAKRVSPQLGLTPMSYLGPGTFAAQQMGTINAQQMMMSPMQEMYSTNSNSAMGYRTQGPEGMGNYQRTYSPNPLNPSAQFQI